LVRPARRADRWRQAALGSWALAAAAAGFLLLRPEPAAPRFVAVLEPPGAGAAFIATVDLGKGTIAVRPVTATAPAGKSYELWAVGGGRDKPQSLGVIEANFRVPSSRLGGSALGETVFAVSLEPVGGSPTGQPTGPVLFTGKLVPAE
jgi:anti-sigma-K factor RskA